ncbi:hypothetical protein EVA_10506, partial [gut metagenome]
VYTMVQEVGQREDLDVKVLQEEVGALSSYWTNRFLGRRPDTLN